VREWKREQNNKIKRGERGKERKARSLEAPAAMTRRGEPKVGREKVEE
jgi:hypothetical protein